MAAVFDYHFEWDATKAANNQRKHRISFDLAATVFRDPYLSGDQRQRGQCADDFCPPCYQA